MIVMINIYSLTYSKTTKNGIHNAAKKRHQNNATQHKNNKKYF